MPKVLYIGHLYEGHSGWSRCAQNYIRALKTQDIEVVARPVFLNQVITPPQDIIECLTGKLDGVTHVIQHILPHWMDSSGNVKNIALCILESRHIEYSDWATQINLLDEAWIPYEQGLLEPGITIPKSLIPHACNIDEYYELHSFLPLPPTFNFYTINDFIHRKNLPAIIRAFHTEFSVNEPVNLIIKTSKFNTSADQCRELVQKQINVVKEGLKLYPSLEHYKRELILTERMTHGQIIALHQGCHCYINSSFGETWGYGSFDSMAYGNSVISTNFGGPVDYLRDYSNGYLVNSREENCFATLDTFRDIQSARENWNSISVLELRKSMRNVYENHKNKREEGLEIAKRYSYENIGKIMMERICESN